MLSGSVGRRCRCLLVMEGAISGLVTWGLPEEHRIYVILLMTIVFIADIGVLAGDWSSSFTN